jgi:hypothetical protein
MRERIFVLLTAGAFICTCLAYGQDAQSLGDAARQARLQKQQKDAQTKEAVNQDPSKDAQSADATAKASTAPKSPHVITNDEIPEHVGSNFASAHNSQTRDSHTPDTSDAPANSGNHDPQAEQWKSQIQAQKSAIASLEREIASLNESVHYAGGNCVANCVQWNERQKEKQDRVEIMKHQLDEQQQRLEDLQESARKQGFGSAVYEP